MGKIKITNNVKKIYFTASEVGTMEGIIETCLTQNILSDSPIIQSILSKLETTPYEVRMDVRQ